MLEIEKKWSEVKLKVWGDYACFTRPEMKVERVSYDVMTPAAARGLLEAVLWKPAIRWKINRIDVLKPIRFTSVRRNEVGTVYSSSDGIFVEEKRQQRAGLILQEVGYTIHARFELTGRAKPDESVQKFSEMFRRRASKGQCFHRPYLGCREFPADFELVDFDQPEPETIPETRDLGIMFHDYLYENGAPEKKRGKEQVNDGPAAAFFRVNMIDGRIVVPPLESREVMS